METFEDWTATVDQGYGVDVIYLDYSKAFYTVPHYRLIEKLKGYGISGNLLMWLRSFFEFDLRITQTVNYQIYFGMVSKYAYVVHIECFQQYH